MSTSALPPAYTVNEVKLQSVDDGKIVGVSLYSNRADVSRRFKLTAAAGQNLVIISGLPNNLDKSSIRVEGQGLATIHDVYVTKAIPEKAPTTSAKLEQLLERKEDVDKSIERCKSSQGGLEEYIKSVRAKDVNPTDVLSIVDNYYSATEKYDNMIAAFKRELKKINKEIVAERAALTNSVTVNWSLLMTASIGLFAESETSIELVLKYVVTAARWEPKYDIRANTQSQKNIVEILYKASVTQDSGEDWNDVPLVLETAAPSFALSIPSLDSWPLVIYHPSPSIQKKKKRQSVFSTKSRATTSSTAEALKEEESDDDMGFGSFDGGPAPDLSATYAAISSKGEVNATYKIAGLITIPSDGVAHSVTVASMVPDAKLSWACVPSIDVSVHLTANVKNVSEYTLLSGPSSVFVDGAFISNSTVPLVSPQETFTCSLGLDPSIRVTYHPRIKKASQSGLINKTSSTAFSQRITIHNSKSSVIDNLKITDRIPIAQDAQINIKLLSPDLIHPDKATGAGSKDLKKTVKVSEGIVAQWHGADEEVTNSIESLGKDGKFDWICSVPAQKKIDLNSQWEVSAPIQATVLGL